MQIGADIFKRALRYPSKLIAENAGKNGNFVVDKVCKSCVLHLSNSLFSVPLHKLLSVHKFTIFVDFGKQ